MYTLIIETSTERSIVAFVKDSKLSFFAGLPSGHNSSRYLISKIEEGLKCLHITTKEIELIIVGKGPGSYTGIRVGVAAAKTLSYVHKIPMIGICSLKGFIPDHDGAFAAMIDAKIRGVYLLVGNKIENQITYLSEPIVCSLVELKNKMQNIKVIVSPSYTRIKSQIQKDFLNQIWEWQETSPDPLHLYKIGIESYNKGHFSLDNSLEISYLT